MIGVLLPHQSVEKVSVPQVQLAGVVRHGEQR